MRQHIGARAAAVTALTALAAALAAPSGARAQDHVNVTIVAPTLGGFPRLVAGTFDVTNSDKLIQHTSTMPNGTSSVVMASGTNEPVKVEMTLPWGGELPQLIQAMVSGVIPTPIDHITCDFVHAGSSQPYYTIQLDRPLISHISLAYDSASATATEQLQMQAPQIEFMDGSASTTAATSATGTSARAMVHGIALPSVRFTASPSMLRQMTAMTSGVSAGPPADAFASFAAPGSSTTHFAPEGTFPAWATGAMANVESFTLTFERAILVHTQNRPDGTAQAFPVYGNMQPTEATFIKPVGSLSNDLQTAISGHQRVTTTFEFADVPGRLAYSIQFINGIVSSDHTSVSNGRATEQVTVAGATQVQVTNLRNNVTVQAH